MSAVRRCLVMAASLALVFVLISVFKGTATRSDRRFVEAAPAFTPPCLIHTTSMTLSASNTTPRVGETILVTSILANEGCSGVGVPQYRLSMQSSQSPPVLVPDPPEPITHILGIAPGRPDSAEFSLQVVGSGQVTLRSSSSFEVHLGYPGPAYWSGDSTEPLTITVPTTDTEVLVLHQAAYEVGCIPELGCSPDVIAEGATYRSVWVVAAGHAADAQIQRFSDKAEALLAFEAARGTLALQSFHCYPAYDWLHDQETMPVRQQGQSWVADRWLVTTHSFDDTGIPVAPSPVAVSEAIYRAATLNELFGACGVVYLPLVLRSQY